jgi:hypothetical protein
MMGSLILKSNCNSLQTVGEGTTMARVVSPSHPQTPAMTLEAEGPDGLFAVFSEDEGAGYFRVYEPKRSEELHT